MTDSERGGPRWAARLAELCDILRRAHRKGVRDEAWEEAWILLNAGLGRYLAMHAARMGPIPPDDLHDLAAEKSLELLDRAVSGVWDTAGRRPAEVAAYLSTVARHELIDWRGRAGRTVPLDAGVPGEPEGTHPEAESSDLPDLDVERSEFASDLFDCVATLDERSRRIWFFRTFYEMRSREIAAHPDVGLNTAHVDVVFSRGRRAIGECMESKGHTRDAIPQGAFFELWRRLRAMPPVRGDLT